MASPKPEKRLDELLMAKEAMGVAREVSGNARLVGCLLLSYLNRRSQRLHPSIPTLTRLSGLSRASVMRALDELCDEREGADPEKFFERWPHFGRGRTTFYIVRWQRFRAVADRLASEKAAITSERIDGAGKTDSALTLAQKKAAQARGADDAETVSAMTPSDTIEHDENRAEEVGAIAANSLTGDTVTVSPATPKQSHGRHRNSLTGDTVTVSPVTPELLKGTYVENSKREPWGKTHNLPSGGSAREGSRSDAAFEAAQRRMQADVSRLPRDQQELFWNVMSKNQYGLDIALRKEVEQPGSGFTYVRDFWPEFLEGAGHA